MDPFVSSCGNTYILITVDYVSKWVEAVALPNNEARSMVAFLKKNIFTRFGTPRAIISDEGHIFATNLLTLYLENELSKKLDDALWAYRTTYKTPIKISPYQLVFRKVCHLTGELDHKTMWTLKKLNLDGDVAANLKMEHLNELDEFWYHAYASLSLYKEKMKYLHDKCIWNKELKVGHLVLLFNSSLRIFPGILKS
ncbi:uncharacterized protein [Nicotiana sylvestris]|uniref:uncharacterized protein n=1 Tax=Nicotiana sylvestris TaxID=4096 RepID=UPI00388C918A